GSQWEFGLFGYVDGTILLNLNGSVQSSAGTVTRSVWHLAIFGVDTTAGKTFLSIDNGTEVLFNFAAAQNHFPANTLRFGTRKIPDTANRATLAYLERYYFWKGQRLDATQRSRLWNGGRGIGYLGRQIQPTFYYVSASGSDSANGTSPSTPWQTITKVN